MVPGAADTRRPDVEIPDYALDYVIYTSGSTGTPKRVIRTHEHLVAETRALMQPDGIHPSAAAQPRILDNVWSGLAPLLDGGSG